MQPQIRILAVEDNAGIRELLQQIFSGAGMQARVVGTMSAFRDYFAREGATVCIVDIGLPDGDGLSLVSELRAAGGRGVVILTGRGSEIDHVIGLEMGADDYIVKPFRQRELLARVKAVARRFTGAPEAPPVGSAAASSQDVVHGYAIDLNARTVTDSDGNDINMTTAEFDVLSVIVAHRGRGLSRDDITKLVKGASWHASDRAIDGLVSRLRKKLPPPDDIKDVIKTLHGVGYMLTPEPISARPWLPRD